MATVMQVSASERKPEEGTRNEREDRWAGETESRRAEGNDALRHTSVYKASACQRVVMQSVTVCGDHSFILQSLVTESWHPFTLGE